MLHKAAGRLSSVEFWLYGLISGFIGGGATAVVSAGGLAAAHASGIDVPVLNFKAMGIVFLCAGVSSAMAYLAKSPLPPIAENVPVSQGVTKPLTVGSEPVNTEPK